MPSYLRPTRQVRYLYIYILHDTLQLKVILIHVCCCFLLFVKICMYYIRYEVLQHYINIEALSSSCNQYFWWHLNWFRTILEFPLVLLLTTQDELTSSGADYFHFYPSLTVAGLINHFHHRRTVSCLGLEGSLFPQTIPKLSIFPRWAFC